MSKAAIGIQIFPDLVFIIPRNEIIESIMLMIIKTKGRASAMIPKENAFSRYGII